MKKNSSLTGKNIVLGVTGGIAAYKSCEIVRLLTAEGADVHVVMTRGATQFVTPMTFQALSRNTVRTDIFNLTEESEMGHIQLADKADLILVAPATADFIARVAHGICDDLLSTVVCATKAPVLFAPAMNVNMYENKIVQENIATLKRHGYMTIGPATGDLACGWEGMGRMEEPEAIVAEVKKRLMSKIKAVR
ncbi:MAG: bifunctional phosphopantothenoylcysteine decarboxylase/phosphopantothenate--cysteine ligase CoaBC [Deltaproteobacteria bacterium]|nr:bifunctional phosphopantothenoylcysteine decarboxylase/phosphopantothenate--cysteine ligase CoaBC [Deltaproteobacteria bacterium]